MVELKVRKFGNSLGVVLPKEVGSRLHTGDGQRLYLIEAPDGSYLITPYDPSFEEKMAKVEDICNRYATPCTYWLSERARLDRRTGRAHHS